MSYWKKIPLVDSSPGKFSPEEHSHSVFMERWEANWLCRRPFPKMTHYAEGLAAHLTVTTSLGREKPAKKSGQVRILENESWRDRKSRFWKLLLHRANGIQENTKGKDSWVQRAVSVFHISILIACFRSVTDVEMNYGQSSYVQLNPSLRNTLTFESPSLLFVLNNSHVYGRVKKQFCTNSLA